MEPLKPIESLSEMWALGYKIRRVHSDYKRAAFQLVAPDGLLIGVTHDTEGLIAAVNRHRQTTPGAA